MSQVDVTVIGFGEIACIVLIFTHASTEMKGWGGNWQNNNQTNFKLQPSHIFFYDLNKLWEWFQCPKKKIQKQSKYPARGLMPQPF